MSQRLNKLGNLCDLHRSLSNRQVAASVVRGHRYHETLNSVDEHLSIISHLVRVEVQRAAENAARILDNTPVSQKGEGLRRLFDRLNDFFQTLRKNVGPDEHEDHDILRLLTKTATNLIDFYETSGELSEANFFRQRLVTLRKQHNLEQNEFDNHEEAEAFDKLSERASEDFRALKLPAMCTRLVPKLANIFPAAHLAVNHGRQDTALTILRGDQSKATEVDILNRNIRHLAAELGDHSLLQACGSHGEDPDSHRDVFKMTALCVAACTGNLALFRELHQAGSRLDVRDVADRSVLCIAAGAGHLEIVRYVLANGCRPNDGYNLEQDSMVQPHNYPPLHAAAAGGHVEIATLLLQHHASAVYICNDRTAAQEAYAYGHTQLAQLLSKAELEQKKNLARLRSTWMQDEQRRPNSPTSEFITDLEYGIASSTASQTFPSPMSQTSSLSSGAIALPALALPLQSSLSSTRPSPTPSEGNLSDLTESSSKRRMKQRTSSSTRKRGLKPTTRGSLRRFDDPLRYDFLT